ncbi:hypothetical protein WA1_29720 [Scytonema hofmannii PCC 7110]|uniref:Oligosaccharide repeat unit polymerase n=1 Tax=Scytonema hofmannii PCC 7110 TaxID=128403 RepID=A0A139X621_9CYAN|nr:hypothetical protein [Scytonema hofmannii]KYC40125.1 hypothetical protein WA1_29720 [Scytonema hofmannii PCC 7110]
MLATAYLGLIVFIIFLEFFRKKAKAIDFLSLFNIIYILMYPLPALILDADSRSSSSILNFRSTLYISNIQTGLAIFIGYFVVVIGFYSSSSPKNGKNIFIKSKDNSVILLACFLLLLSIVSIHLYSSQYGGFVYALSNANLIRQQAEIVDTGGALVFFKHFMGLSQLTSYLVASFLFIKKTKTRRVFLYFIFIFSVVLSTIAVTMIGSRGGWISYYIVFYLVYVLQTEKFSWGFVIPFICFISLFIVYGKPLFFSLTALPDGFGAMVEKFQEFLNNSPDEGFSFEKFMSSFVYPLHSLDAAFYTHYEPRLFVDWIYAFVTLLPERLLNDIEVPKTISYYNTYYIIGTNEYEIPTGFLAFGVYSMSWFGLIVVCFAYGWIGRYLQNILLNNIFEIPWVPFLYIVIAKIWLDYFTAGDPRILIFPNLGLLFSVTLLLSLASKITIVKPQNQKIIGRKSCVR